MITEHKTLPPWTFSANRIDATGEPVDAAVWSGENQPPAIGDRVYVKLNSLGYATVTGYFVQEGWLGVEVKLEKKASHVWEVCTVFGAEIRNA